MTTTFLENLLTQMRVAYLRHTGLNKCRDLCDLSLEYNWLNINYNIDKGIEDVVYVRLEKDSQITVDVTPAKDTMRLCVMSDRGIRWIDLESKPDQPTTPRTEILNEREKTVYEGLTKALYAIAEEKEDILRLLLRKPIATSWTKKA